MVHQSLRLIISNANKKGKIGWKYCIYILHQVLQEIFGGAYEILCRLHIFTPRVIVMVDGGICSQMHQYLIGQLYEKHGIVVEYDLTWYSRNGLDVDHRFTREFELLEMYPDLPLKTPPAYRLWFYKTFLCHAPADQRLPLNQIERVAPIYLGGYYILYDEELFTSTFQELYAHYSLENRPSSLLKKRSEGQKRCAIHVRRGDLAKGDNPWYGGVQDDYFFKAIDRIEEMFHGTRYYFFSDEPEYVESQIVPSLSVEYEIVHGPHKAYEDLILISQCDIIVASQGSFGKYAALLNDKSLLVLQNDKFAPLWLKRKKNSITI